MNVAEFLYTGIEASFEAFLSPEFSFGANYTWIDGENKTDVDLPVGEGANKKANVNEMRMTIAQAIQPVARSRMACSMGSISGDRTCEGAPVEARPRQCWRSGRDLNPRPPA